MIANTPAGSGFVGGFRMSGGAVGTAFEAGDFFFHWIDGLFGGAVDVGSGLNEGDSKSSPLAAG